MVAAGAGDDGAGIGVVGLNRQRIAVITVVEGQAGQQILERTCLALALRKR